MSAPSHIPRFYCARCQRMLEYGTDVGRYTAGKRRYLLVQCHGERLELPFVVEPGTITTLWEDQTLSRPHIH